MGKQLSPGLRMLMAEDSEEDVFFVKRALHKTGVELFFHAVADGLSAISYLRGEGEYSDREKFPFPNLLLTDLKMPRLDGFGILAWLQSHPECKVIPTIVFSSSALERDIHKAYVLGANAYLSKPNRLEELVDLILVTYKFWSRCETPVPPLGEKCA